MSESSIEKLAQFGQSIWLDSINRSMITNGKLQETINMGLKGMTSNPTIFDVAISSGDEYDEKIKELKDLGKSTFEIYDELTVKDVQDAADLFRPVYESTGALDGYVSLEVNPKLAFQTDETIKEALRLHKKVDRSNVMFKVPATEAGIPAIEELVSKGININVTLIFSLEQYVNTAKAYVRGIKRLLETGADISRTFSVASVFISRIDTAVDKLLDDKISTESNEEIKSKLESLKGRAAVANSAIIFKKFQSILQGNEFLQLQGKGANAQRTLWGSTGTKNPGYSDIKYVSELIGKPSVNTLPQKTLDAFLDHGTVNDALSQNNDAEQVINTLTGLGIDINSVCDRLLSEGVVSFENSFDSLLNTINKKAGIS